MKKGLLRQAVTGRYDRHGEVSDADCVVGFSFGYRATSGHLVPGVSNEILAALIAERYCRFPLILQWEIAAALTHIPRQLWRIERHAESGRYLDTREVARQARTVMKAQQYETALIVAHPHHVARADAVCTRLGMRTVVPDGLEKIGFDPRSHQPWTRTQPTWSVRETMAIAYYDLVGWL